MKKKKTPVNASGLTTDELIAKIGGSRRVSGKTAAILLPLFVAIPVLLMVLAANFGRTTAELADGDVVTMASVPLAAASAKKDLISVPSGIVKANPFLPYRDIDGTQIKKPTLVNDVPKFDLIEPPDFVNENSDAAKVMDTVVSGILYDKYSPSAILNIEGNDYLVKKGDVVNNYRVMNIQQNSVTVKLGSNTYTAGIGEILTDGSVNYNTVSNLSKKFGGERK